MKKYNTITSTKQDANKLFLAKTITVIFLIIIFVVTS